MGKIIAVDFDGTICDSRYPGLGPPNMDVIRRLKDEQKNGAKLILWTSRSGDALKMAVDFCDCYGLRFDAVNDNLPESVALWGSNSRKVWADEYWDDKAQPPSLPTCDNCRFRKSSTRPQRSIYTWCANSCKNYSPRGEK